MKINETPCTSCINFSVDQYGNFKCSKRATKYSDGYGEFEIGARCIYDYEMLDNYYAPVSSEKNELTRLKKENEKLKSDNYYMKKDIEEIRDSLENFKKYNK